MWLQPKADLPGRAPLEEPLVHVRRERVFLWLAGFFIAAAVMLPLLGFSKWFGVSSVVRDVGLEPPMMLLVPIGALAWPVAVLAANLVGELYGASRVRSLVFTLVFIWLGVLGLLWATDHVVDYEHRVTSSFGIGAVLVGSGLLGLIVQTELFAWIDTRWLRHVGATLIAVAAGWGAFWLALEQLDVAGAPAGDELLGATFGAAGFVGLAVVIGTIPVVLIARALAVYLRIELRTKPVYDELDDLDALEPAFVPNKRTFSSQEMAFFEVGDRDP